MNGEKIMKVKTALKVKVNILKRFTYGWSEKRKGGAKSAFVRTQRGRDSTTGTLCDHHHHHDAVDDESMMTCAMLLIM